MAVSMTPSLSIREGIRLRRRADGTTLDARYHLTLGEILEAKGDLQGALSEYEAELRENPDSDEARRARIVSLRVRHPVP